MPFNKPDIICLSNETVEYVNKEQIATLFGVALRTVERLIEVYIKKLKRNRRKRGRKWEYYWPDVLRCVKLHKGLAKEVIPSMTIKRAYTKLGKINSES